MEIARKFDSLTLSTFADMNFGLIFPMKLIRSNFREFVAAPKSLPAHQFNALIFPILRGCVQSFVSFLSLTTSVTEGEVAGVKLA